MNGGFEWNNFLGWTTGGSCSLTSSGTDARTLGALSTVGIGLHSVKVGDENAWGYTGPQYSSIKQKELVGAGDLNDLYFVWAAVGLVPTNTPHGELHTPYFQIDVNWYQGASMTRLYSEEHFTGDLGATTPGWLRGANQGTGLGYNDPGVWYYRPWNTFHLNLSQTGIQAGDYLEVVLTTRDCDLGGHASYAYLDGFGSSPPPIPSVPEPPAPALWGCGLLALTVGAIRRRRG
jgi:hypothetical protein